MRDRTIGTAALVGSGVVAYLFLAVGARSLGAERFAPLGTLWSLVFLATAAIAAPLETELSRRIGAARARGTAHARDIRAAFAVAVIAGLVAIGGALLLGPSVDAVLFSGERGFTLLGAIAFAGLTAGAAAKGACAGGGRLAWWGAYLLADGSTRFGLAVAASLLWAEPLAFALALALGPWLALAVPAGAVRGLLRRGAERFEALAASRGADLRRAGILADAWTLMSGTSPLVIAAAASSGLMYLGAVMLPALVPGPDARVGAYIAALSLARLPLFVFSPVVAVAVPRIAYAVARDDRTARRAALGFVCLALVAAALALGGAWVGGSDLVVMLFGRGFELPRASLLSIALAAGTWLVATASASVAIAAGRPRLAALSWCLGLAAALVAAALPLPDQFERTNLTVVAGALVASLAAATAAAHAIRSPHPGGAHP